MNAQVQAVPEAGPRRVRQILLALLMLGVLALMVGAVATVFALDASAATSTRTTSAPRDANSDAHSYSLHGDRVAIFNLAGRVSVEAGRGPDVVVEVSTAGRDADQLRVETGDINGHSTLRVVYPASRVTYPDMEFGSKCSTPVRDDGTFGGFDEKTGWSQFLPRALGGRSRQVTVSRGGGGVEAWADIRILVPAGRSLEAHLLAGHSTVNNVDGRIALDLGAADVLADGVRGALLLDSGSGTTEARNVTGDLDMDTGSGEVRVSNVKGGHVSLDTGSGSVRGSDVDATELLIDTGSGEVRITGIHAPEINVDTGSGEVSLGIESAIHAMKIDTGSGGVTLNVPRSLSAEIEMDSGSGGFDCDLPMQVIRRDDSYLKARIGDGRGRIAIDTGSGGVRVRSN